MRKRYKITATCYDKRGRIISIGVNSYCRTHPLQKKYSELAGLHDKQFLHAEIDALLKAKGKAVHRIHVERYDDNGVQRLAKPCPICALAIKKFGVKVVSYTI